MFLLHENDLTTVKTDYKKLLQWTGLTFVLFIITIDWIPCSRADDVSEEDNLFLNTNLKTSADVYSYSTGIL